MEVRVEISPDEYVQHLKNAAFTISEKIHVDGFRKGKAPYDVIVKQVGEHEVWQEALEPAVKKILPKVLVHKKILSIGAPHIEVEKLAPGNPVVYKATVSVLPNTTLADISSVRVTKKIVNVEDRQVEQEIDKIRKMRAQEVLVERAAQNTDKVIIHFKQFLDKVLIENGDQKDFPLVLGEQKFIPDFEKNIIGMKSGDKKKFTVNFPKEYHQKNLAGKPVDFEVEMVSVFELKLPELNDEFAKGLGGFQGIVQLRDQLKNSMKEEAFRKEEERIEDEIMDKIITASKFGEIPDLLVNSETKKMLSELEQNIAAQGMKFEDYLEHLKKTRADLLLEFSSPAVKRVKASLVMRTIAQSQKFDATFNEIQVEKEKLKSAHRNNREVLTQIETREFSDYIRNIIVSRKVMDYLKKIVLKDK